MPRKWWVLFGVGCGTFMATLDASIVNIALPTLTRELHTSFEAVKWVVIIYFLVITCLLLPFGRISDQYGRKKIFSTGFLIFTFGSALCGLSPQVMMMVLARVIQAVGASMLMANGPAIITATFPARERGKALGTLAMIVSVGLISGPSLGGILIDQLGWRSIFLVNIPIGLMGFYLISHFVPKDRRSRKVFIFDYKGLVLQSLFLVSFIITFDSQTISRMIAPLFSNQSFEIQWILATITLVFGVLFIRVEKKVPIPLFDLSLLKNRTFWTANLAGFLIFVAYSSVAVLMPFFLEISLGFSTYHAGLYMAVIPLTIFVIAPFSGRLSDLFGSKELCVLGSAIEALALFYLSGAFGPGIHKGSALSLVILGLTLVGAGLGFFQAPNNNAIMSAVPQHKLGVASAFIATVRNLGLVTGAGFATGVYTWQHRATADLESAIQVTYFIAAFIAIGSIIASLGKQKGPYWK